MSEISAVETDPLAECLVAAARYHSVSATREMVVSGLPLPGKILVPSLFSRAASRIGMASRLVRKSLEHLEKGLLPAVLLLKDDRACLLVDNGDDGSCRIIDPEFPEAPRKIERGELEGQYTGTAILVRPRHSVDERAGRARRGDEGHWFWSALKANSRVYRDVLIAAALVNTFALAVPFFIMNVYDRVVPNHAVETLWMLAGGVAIILLADLVLRTIRGYFVDLAGRRVDLSLSSRVMEKVLGLKLEARPQSTGSFSSNLRSYESVRDFITSASLLVVIDLPFALVFLLVIGWIAWPLMLPLLAGVAIVFAVALLSRKRMQQLAETTYRANAQRNAVLVESLVGLETLKSMGAESLMQKRWEQSNAFLGRVGLSLRLLSLSNLNVTQFVQQLVTVSIVVTGVYLITGGNLSMGGLIAATMLSSRTLAPMAQGAGLLVTFHNARTAMAGLEEIMAMPEERPGDKAFLSRANFRGEVVFRDVSFNYPGSDVPCLRNVSFSIKPGERVVFLGRVGSGKTTLLKLAMGLYTPTEGAVLIDGIDMRQLDPAELRRHVGYVPQDVTLFQGTLRDNITLTHPQAEDEQIVEAAEMACLGEFVNAHPQGFDMPVGERGELLSGGQRKSVGLARAVIHAPPIVLLDEPTGSMDHSTESWVKERFASFLQGRTAMVVTHRTPFIDLADRIIVVDKGCIVADGPRDKVVEALRQGRIGKAS